METLQAAPSLAQLEHIITQIYSPLISSVAESKLPDNLKNEFLGSK